MRQIGSLILAWEKSERIWIWRLHVKHLFLKNLVCLIRGNGNQMTSDGLDLTM